VPSGPPPVCAERIAGGLVGHLLGAIVGSAVGRGTSFLKEAWAKRLFRAEIRSSTMPLSAAASPPPFDAEGGHPPDPAHRRGSPRQLAA
jgi:PmbA protein